MDRRNWPLGRNVMSEERDPSVKSVQMAAPGKIEILRMQLVACMTAAVQNTEETRTDRIDRGNIYWSQAYEDVCRAVDREISLRQKLAAITLGAAAQANSLHAKWVSDVPNNGTYTLALDEKQTSAFFADIEARFSTLLAALKAVEHAMSSWEGVSHWDAADTAAINLARRVIREASS